MSATLNMEQLSAMMQAHSKTLSIVECASMLNACTSNAVTIVDAMNAWMDIRNRFSAHHNMWYVISACYHLALYRLMECNNEREEVKRRVLVKMREEWNRACGEDILHNVKQYMCHTRQFAG